jgi:hypothetical protein
MAMGAAVSPIVPLERPFPVVIHAQGFNDFGQALAGMLIPQPLVAPLLSPPRDPVLSSGLPRRQYGQGQNQLHWALAKRAIKNDAARQNGLFAARILPFVGLFREEVPDRRQAVRARVSDWRGHILRALELARRPHPHDPPAAQADD